LTIATAGQGRFIFTAPGPRGDWVHISADTVMEAVSAAWAARDPAGPPDQCVREDRKRLPA
jgi:hypothetical protein